MVSKKEIYSYGFKTLYEYFQYILESRINGNISACRQLIMDLSKPQSIEFITWLNLEKKQAEDSGDYEYLTNLTLQILKT